LGTAPSVYYLPPVDRLVDFEDGLDDFKEFESVEPIKPPEKSE
jgi:molybdopterin-containing oxidoreductase family iron-sulfur binding subunit